MNAHQLHNLAYTKAKELRKNYRDLFEILLEVEKRQIYLQFESPSLYDYCAEVLDLSKDIARDFNIVVKKSLEVPMMAEAILKNEVSISKMRKVCPVITEEDSTHWLELAKKSTARAIEKVVATERPRELVRESMKYVAENTLEFKLAVTEEWEQLLIRTKELMAQKSSRHVTSEEALFKLLKHFCENHDPVQKAQRAQARTKSKERGSSPTQNGAKSREQDSAFTQRSRSAQNCAAKPIQEPPLPTDVEPTSERARHIPTEIENAVHLRDRAQCTVINHKGRRCPERKWLHIHHIKPFSQGGEHTLENLTTLCFAHHKIAHLAHVT